MTAVAGALALVAGIAACSGASEAEDPAAASAGGGSVEEAAGASVPSLELVTRIGCADCGDARQLTPTVIALFDDGKLAVLDRYEPFVRVFDAEGEPLRSFGAPGQGPGELGNDVGGMYFAGVYLLPWPDGRLSVLELMPAVLETFAADGAFVEREQLDLPFGSPRAQAFSSATGRYFRSSFVPTTDEPEVILKCDIEQAGESDCGHVVNTRELLGPSPDGSRAFLAFGATAAGELVVADTATYRLRVVDAEGNVVREFGRDTAPPPKSAAELETEREANRVRRERGRLEREIDPNRGYIAPSGLQVDGAGRTWVLTMRYTDTTSVFDVFQPDGTYLGEVVLEIPTTFNPNGITPFVTAGDRLAVMTDLADGTAVVYVYRIVGS